MYRRLLPDVYTLGVVSRHYSRTLILRVSPEDLDTLDATRGDLTRSAWVRQAISQTGRSRPAPAEPVTPLAVEAPVRAADLRNDPTHRHRRDQGTVVGTRMGREIRTYRCLDCGKELR